MHPKCLEKLEMHPTTFSADAARWISSKCSILECYNLRFMQNGHGFKASKLFNQIQRTSIQVTYVTTTSLLLACTSLALGKEIHYCIMSSGLDLNAFVGSFRIDMYVKCRRVEDAHQVFEKTHQRCGFVECNDFRICPK